jgi:hypothetical protein
MDLHICTDENKKYISSGEKSKISTNLHYQQTHEQDEAYFQQKVLKLLTQITS